MEVMTEASSILAIELETCIAKAGASGMSLPQIRGTLSQALAKVETAQAEEWAEMMKHVPKHAVAKYRRKRYDRPRR